MIIKFLRLLMELSGWTSPERENIGQSRAMPHEISSWSHVPHLVIHVATSIALASKKTNYGYLKSNSIDSSLNGFLLGSFRVVFYGFELAWNDLLALTFFCVHFITLEWRL